MAESEAGPSSSGGRVRYVAINLDASSRPGAPKVNINGTTYDGVRVTGETVPTVFMPTSAAAELVAEWNAKTGSSVELYGDGRQPPVVSAAALYSNGRAAAVGWVRALSDERWREVMAGKETLDTRDLAEIVGKSVALSADELLAVTPEIRAISDGLSGPPPMGH